MSTTQKHRDFVDEPMGDKKVDQIAGIGDAYGSRLEEHGYEKASQVYGQYLVDDKDEDKFIEFLEDNADVRSDHANSAYNCINEWDRNHS